MTRKMFEKWLKLIKIFFYTITALKTNFCWVNSYMLGRLLVCAKNLSCMLCLLRVYKIRFEITGCQTKSQEEALKLLEGMEPFVWSQF